MVDRDDGPAPEARPPSLADLVSPCRNLNQERARYLIIGGMAIIQAGFVRATEDIDLLVDTSSENMDRVRAALLKLPDGAIRDMADDDLERYAAMSAVSLPLSRSLSQMSRFPEQLETNEEERQK